MRVSVLRSAAPTVNGTQQSFTADASFASQTLVGARLFITRNIAEGPLQNHTVIGWGMTDGVTHAAACAYAEHNVPDTDARRRGYATAVLGILDPLAATATDAGRASFVSMSGRTLTIQWDVAPPAARLVTCVLYFAGAGEGFRVRKYDVRSGNQVISDLPWEFSALIAQSSITGFDDGSTDEFQYSPGYAWNNSGTIVQRAIGTVSSHATVNVRSGLRMEADRVAQAVGLSGTNNTTDAGGAGISTPTATGLTVTQIGVGVRGALAILKVSNGVHLSTVQFPNSTGTLSHEPGFPGGYYDAVLCHQGPPPAASGFPGGDSMQWSCGSKAEGNAKSWFFANADGSDPTSTMTRQSTDAFWLGNNAGTAEKVASIQAWDALGVDFNVTTATGATSSYFFILTIEEHASGAQAETLSTNTLTVDSPQLQTATTSLDAALSASTSTVASPSLQVETFGVELDTPSVTAESPTLGATTSSLDASLSASTVEVSSPDLRTSETSFLDHFDGGVLDTRWGTVGSVTVDADSFVVLDSPTNASTSAIYLAQKLNLAEDQVLRVMARRVSGTSPLDLISLVSMPPGQVPNATTTGNVQSQERVSISLVHVSADPSIILRRNHSVNGAEYWNQTTKAWGAYSDAVNRIAQGAAADWYEVAIVIQGGQIQLHHLAGKESTGDPTDRKQGIISLAQTNWIDPGSVLGSMQDVYLVIGDRKNDNHACTYHVEFVEQERGPFRTSVTNAKTTNTIQQYTLRRNHGYLQQFSRSHLESPVLTVPGGARGHRKKCTLQDGSTLRFYYEQFNSTASASDIRLASGADWDSLVEDAGNPILELADLPGAGAAYNQLTSPFVIKDLGESDPAKLFKMFVAAQVSATSEHRVFLFTSPAFDGPWTRYAGSDTDGSVMAATAAVGQEYRAHGAGEPAAYWNEGAGHWDIVFSGFPATSDPWNACLATAPANDIGNWTVDPANPKVQSDGSLQAWSTPSGNSITVTNGAAFRRDQVVYLRNGTTSADYGISRVRKITGNVVELYHRIAGLTSGEIVSVEGGSIAPRGVVDLGDELLIYCTLFQPFKTGAGSFGNHEGSGFFRAASLTGAWTLDDIRTPSPRLSDRVAERYNENTMFVLSPVARDMAAALSTSTVGATSPELQQAQVAATLQASAITADSPQLASPASTLPAELAASSVTADSPQLASPAASLGAELQADAASIASPDLQPIASQAEVLDASTLTVTSPQLQETTIAGELDASEVMVRSPDLPAANPLTPMGFWVSPVDMQRIDTITRIGVWCISKNGVGPQPSTPGGGGRVDVTVTPIGGTFRGSASPTVIQVTEDTLDTSLAFHVWDGIPYFGLNLDPAEFSYDGNATLTATIIENGGGTRALPSRTVRVNAGGTLVPAQSEAWVEAGWGGASSLGNPAEPYPTMSAARGALSAANGGDLSECRLILKAGTHAPAREDYPSANGYVEITKDPAAADTAVIIQATDTSSWIDGHNVHFKDVTLRSTALNRWVYQAAGFSGANLWVQCRIEGASTIGGDGSGNIGENGSGDQPIANGNTPHNRYQTECYVENVGRPILFVGTQGSNRLARNVYGSGCWSDAMQNDSAVINFDYDIASHPGDTYPSEPEHADQLQNYGGGASNRCYVNVRLRRGRYTRIEWNMSTPTNNLAFVNCAFHVDDPVLRANNQRTGAANFTGTNNHLVVLFMTTLQKDYLTKSGLNFAANQWNDDPDIQDGVFEGCYFDAIRVAQLSFKTAANFGLSGTNRWNQNYYRRSEFTHTGAHAFGGYLPDYSFVPDADVNPTVGDVDGGNNSINPAIDENTLSANLLDPIDAAALASKVVTVYKWDFYGKRRPDAGATIGFIELNPVTANVLTTPTVSVTSPELQATTISGELDASSITADSPTLGAPVASIDASLEASTATVDAPQLSADLVLAQELQASTSTLEAPQLSSIAGLDAELQASEASIASPDAQSGADTQAELDTSPASIASPDVTAESYGVELQASTASIASPNVVVGAVQAAQLDASTLDLASPGLVAEAFGVELQASTVELQAPTLQSGATVAGELDASTLAVDSAVLEEGTLLAALVASTVDIGSPVLDSQATAPVELLAGTLVVVSPNASAGTQISADLDASTASITSPPAEVTAFVLSLEASTLSMLSPDLVDAGSQAGVDLDASTLAISSPAMIGTLPNVLRSGRQSKVIMHLQRRRTVRI